MEERRRGVIVVPLWLLGSKAYKKWQIKTIMIWTERRNLDARSSPFNTQISPSLGSKIIINRLLSQLGKKYSILIHDDKKKKHGKTEDYKTQV